MLRGKPSSPRPTTGSRDHSRVRWAHVAARDRLSALAPIEVAAEQILYHPEAVVLRVRPARALAGIADALIEATAETITGWDPAGHGDEQWIPHATIAYSTADQPTAPVVAAAGRRIPVCRSILATVSLVERNVDSS